MTTSHSYSDGRCPDYRSCVSCLPRVLECYCIHDSVALWNVTVAEVPKFELQVGECIAASMTLEVTPCLDLMGRECLHLRGAEEPWLSIPWFFAHVRATCNAQPLAHESSAPTRCFDTDWLYGGGSVAMQDASLPTISQYFSIHVSATGFAFSSNSFYNESLPHANAPSTSRDDCSRLIPLAKGVNMIIDRDARYTKVFDSPTTAVIILEPHARLVAAHMPGVARRNERGRDSIAHGPSAALRVKRAAVHHQVRAIPEPDARRVAAQAGSGAPHAGVVAAPPS